jgi:hypothetical protein
MKTSHLIFFLAVAILVAVVSVVPGVYILGDRIDLTRAEFWRLGFGPVAMLLAVWLAVASIAASRGSLLGFRFCCLWLLIISSTFSVLTICHFSGAWSRSIIQSIFVSALWFYMTRNWRIKHDT